MQARRIFVFSIVVACIFGLAGTVSSVAMKSTATESERKAQSIAYFIQMGRVIESVRCLNCHPADRHPTQGDDMHAHNPPIVSDAGGHGVPGFTCKECHGANNFNTGLPIVRTIPGNPAWGLAPAAFAWQHRSLGQICRQIKDPNRNGHRTLTQIHDHVAHDPLVGWAWHPGLGRKPAPGSQTEFGRLTQRWIDWGAACPES